MCRDDTMMRMSQLEHKLLDMLELEAAKGLENVDAKELGEAVDILKDLGEAKYYCSVVMAMEDDGPMGYNERRYQTSGRYAPKGRGEMGYAEPMADDWGMMGAMGHSGGSQAVGNRSGGASVGGYESGPQNGSQGRMGYGAAYDRYQQARMGYQQSRTAENRRGMDEASSEHIREFADTMREMWDDADQSQRMQMRSALVGFVNGLA